MNEDINLCITLKGLEGIVLYSSVFGNVRVKTILDNGIVLETVKDNIVVYHSSNGTISNWDGSECTLFPSKEQRDWSKFNIKK